MNKMVYQEFNLITKTIVSGNPADQDKKVVEFQKTHKVKFAQTHVAVTDGKLTYVIILFYPNPN